MNKGHRKSEARRVARGVRLLALDVDGVLTDGGIYVDKDGVPMKRFDAQDGVGIRLFKEAGFEVAVISGMGVPCVERRLEMLHVTMYAGGYDDKVARLDIFRRQMGIGWDGIAYLGDDWVDIAPMLRVGLPVAVANATPDTMAAAAMVTKREGGHGAVRELVEFLLEAKGLKDGILGRWSALA